MLKVNNHAVSKVPAVAQWENEQEARHDAHRFLKAHVFIEKLHKHSNVLTMCEMSELRQMALDGKLGDAWLKLDAILRFKI